MNASIIDFRSHSLRAFSLSELLVVLVIVGILVLIALPNLMPLISRAKATEAQQQLTYLHTLQKSHFYTYSRYSSSTEELGFEQSTLVTDGGGANYLIEIAEASEHGFRATATAVVDFDGDGVYNVWEIDEQKHLGFPQTSGVGNVARGAIRRLGLRLRIFRIVAGGNDASPVRLHTRRAAYAMPRGVSETALPTRSPRHGIRRRRPLPHHRPEPAVPAHRLVETARRGGGDIAGVVSNP